MVARRTYLPAFHGGAWNPHYKKNDMRDRGMPSARSYKLAMTWPHGDLRQHLFLIAGKNGHPRAMRAPDTYPVRSHLKGGFHKPIFLPHFTC
jgi:hypothetical protein